MTAYILIRVKTDDPKKLRDYQKVTPDIIEKYNGKLIVRGGDVVFLEGLNENKRIVIIEFQTMEEAKAFYYSDEYTQAIKLRQGLADFEMIAVNGLI